jgi:hypothetical protein
VCDDVGTDASEGFAGAEHGVTVGGMRDLFAFYGILLVGESERRIGDATQCVLVIQRCVSGGNHTAVDREGDVAKLEGF